MYFSLFASIAIIFYIILYSLKVSQNILTFKPFMYEVLWKPLLHNLNYSRNHDNRDKTVTSIKQYVLNSKTVLIKTEALLKEMHPGEEVVPFRVTMSMLLVKYTRARHETDL